ncbi:MAG TPA: sensor histidine kinase, partial [Stenotrophomonas sp.]
MEITPRSRWHRLLHPLNLAGLLTWLAVAVTLPYGSAEQFALRWGCALLFLVAFLLAASYDRPAPQRSVLLVIEAVAALAVIRLAASSGVAPALLVMLAAQVAMSWPLRIAVTVMLVTNLGMYLVLRDVHSHPAAVVLIFAGFQAFAMLTTHYASSAEQARDRLALVNA